MSDFKAGSLFISNRDFINGNIVCNHQIAIRLSRAGAPIMGRENPYDLQEEPRIQRHWVLFAIDEFDGTRFWWKSKIQHNRDQKRRE